MNTRWANGRPLWDDRLNGLKDGCKAARRYEVESSQQWVLAIAGGPVTRPPKSSRLGD
jgi:hypothetical protein